MKVRGVFARDADCFPTIASEILYISDRLGGKACDYISEGLKKIRGVFVG
jgi:hypothetical protein